MVSPANTEKCPHLFHQIAPPPQSLFGAGYWSGFTLPPLSLSPAPGDLVRLEARVGATSIHLSALKNQLVALLPFYPWIAVTKVTSLMECFRYTTFLASPIFRHFQPTHLWGCQSPTCEPSEPPYNLDIKLVKCPMQSTCH